MSSNPVAKLRHFFETRIGYPWKIHHPQKIRNTYNSASYKNTAIIPHGKFSMGAWKESREIQKNTILQVQNQLF